MKKLARQSNAPTIIFVVCFLDWLRNWVDPIYPFLQRAGYRVTIFHIQSLSYGVGRDDAPVHPEYEIHDVGGWSAERIAAEFSRRQSCAVVLFNFQSLFELIMMRIARNCGAKTLYLQHGHYNTHTFRYGIINSWSTLRRYRRLLGMFISYLRRTPKSRLGELRVFAAAMVSSDYRQLKCDEALLYSKESFRHIQKHFSYDSKRVHIVGYPVAGSNLELSRYQSLKSTPNGNNVLYIHQAFLRFGFSKISYAREATFLLSMGQMCRDRGLKLTVKLHPRESPRNYEALVHSVNVTLDVDSTLAELVGRAQLVIGHGSTALFCPILFHKPLVVSYFPGLTTWDSTFDKIGMRSRNETELSQILDDAPGWGNHLDGADEFARLHIGPPSTYERLAETIDRIAKGG